MKINKKCIVQQILKISVLLLVVLEFSCKKNGLNTDSPGQVPGDTTLANTIGFFMNDWQPRTFTAPAFLDTTVYPGNITVNVTINPASQVTKIPPSIYGNNANVYMTQMVTQPTLLNYISSLNSHVIRFPGGSLSDLFFWNANAGSHPSDAPDSLPDSTGNKKIASYWSGKDMDSWTMSVDNYYNMLQQTGNRGIITINYAYARYGTSANPVSNAAHLAANWVRYDKGRTKYWEIGNENFGSWETGYLIDKSQNKDGQPLLINGTLYGQHFKVFADSMRNAAKETGATIYISCVLIEQSSGSAIGSSEIAGWDHDVLSYIGNYPDYYSVHSYFTPYQENSTPAVILNSAATGSLTIMDWMKALTTSLHLTQKPIALTEWNINAQGSMQQISFINGMHAALILGESLKNKFGLACRWDLANSWSNGNDQGMFSAGDEPGVPIWNPRPPFYFMYYFQKMTGDKLVYSTIDVNNSNIYAYASKFTSGETGVVLVNTGNIQQIVNIKFQNFIPGTRFYWYKLTGGPDNGSFSRQVYVNVSGPALISGGPLNYATLNPLSALCKNGVKFNLPPYSAVFAVIEK